MNMDNTVKSSVTKEHPATYNSNTNSQGGADVLEEYDIIHAPEPEPPEHDNESNQSKKTVKNVDTLAIATDQQRTNSGRNSAGARNGSEIQNAAAQHAVNKSQSLEIPIICPRVNCPEKILICLDLNEEMDTTAFRSRAGDKYSGLELAQRTIKMFVMHKTQINPKHEFAFLIFHEEPTMIHTFTPRAQDILNTLDDCAIETQKSGPLKLTNLFQTIKDNIELPQVDGDSQVIPPPYVVRVLMVFGRSQCVPVVSSVEAQRQLESSPYFFTDILYIHEPPSEENRCEEIFHVLCDLDHNGMSYIFEESKYTPILNSGAKLLAHPLQRPRQLDASYKIGAPVPAVVPPAAPPS